jgi:hypothetical protein
LDFIENNIYQPELHNMQYIILLELEEKGFIFTSELPEEEALEYVELIFFTTQDYNINKLELLDNINIEHKYLVQNDSIHFKDSSRGISNGLDTAAFIQVDENFDLESYITADEFSIPFDEYEIDDLSEMHPEFSEYTDHKILIIKDSINFNEYKIRWKKELDQVGQYLDKLIQYQDVINGIDLTNILKSKELLIYQDNWFQLQSKYTDIEKDFFKSFWVPIQSDSYQYFIDISNPEFPIISYVFISSDANKYIGYYVCKSVKELIQQCESNFNFSILASNLKKREQELHFKHY